MDDPTTTQQKQTVTKTADDLRQGETPGVVRWVLGLSLSGAIIALVLTYTSPLRH